MTLEQSRKEMYPDPIAVTSWKPPKLRKSSSILERDATDSLASIKADISVDSKVSCDLNVSRSFNNGSVMITSGVEDSETSS